MTIRRGYALAVGEALEHLDMGGGSHLSLRVTGRESAGLVAVLEGIVHTGGPPLHVHESEDEVVVVLEGLLSYQVGEERGELAVTATTSGSSGGSQLHERRLSEQPGSAVACLPPPGEG